MGRSSTRPRTTIRPHGSGDRAGFLDLYEAVWGRRRGAEWFRWRFEENPYLDEVPMVVAEADGRIVGAEPCVVFPLAVGDETRLAFQPADWMVHPDHRRQGLFTGMTERLLDRYADGPQCCYYNYPSDAIRPGLRSQGWRDVGPVPTYYRVQNVERLASGRLATDQPAAEHALALGQVGLSMARGVFSLAAGSDADGWAVERHESVPVDTLVRIYRSGVPDGIHVRRDAAFYRWRFANPLWETTTYVAVGDDGPAASLIAATSDDGDLRCVWALDVLPADGSASLGSYEALLSAVVADAADADVVKCAGIGLPETALRRCGFRRDDAFPLSAVSKRTTAVVRGVDPDGGDPTGREPWRTTGVDPLDDDAWAIQLCGQDVA
ncbi:GNAT family N-acetyltransferase [Halobaculum lipolyticum]|uniref:GNAT family N-acetyltransferase n=1 Tax=Halobaculum lipolyticum TaxID=3032001 RepID=A0ABD5WB93_9EURY|nr:GNAT family N-acetyltransferase [Halobaculum sp. DT31]